MSETEKREAFEVVFHAIELGDGDFPLPTPKDGKLWDEYILRHQLALGIWQAALSTNTAAIDVAEFAWKQIADIMTNEIGAAMQYQMDEYVERLEALKSSIDGFAKDHLDRLKETKP